MSNSPNPNSTVIYDELQELNGQAAGIPTILIEDPHLDESMQNAISAVRDIVLRMDPLQAELHKLKSSNNFQGSNFNPLALCIALRCERNTRLTNLQPINQVLPAMTKKNRGSARWRLVKDENDPKKTSWEWDPSQEDDIDELFARMRNGEGTVDDHNLYDACIIDRFIYRTYEGKPVEPWIARELSNSFFNVLMGGEWDKEFILPGREPPLERPWREKRDFDIYCETDNLIKYGGMSVTAALDHSAASNSVSYETARAAFYRWKLAVSKNKPEIQKDLPIPTRVIITPSELLRKFRISK